MGKPVSIGFTFQTQAGPIPLSELDTNFSALAASINDFGTYSNFLVDTSGAANVITVTTPASTTFSYVAGQFLQIQVANTTTATGVSINVNGLGAKALVNSDGSTPVVGKFVAGQIVPVQYDGTSFRALNPGGTSSVDAFSQLTVGPPASGTALTVNAAVAGGLGLDVEGTVGGAVAKFGIPGLSVEFFMSGGVAQLGSLTNSPLGFYVNNGAVALEITTASDVLIDDQTGTTTLVEAGYRGLPQKSISGAYTPIRADAGKYLDCAASTAVTMPTNGAVPYPPGTAISFLGDFGSGSMTIAAGAGESLFWAGQGAVVAGTRTLGIIGLATLLRVSTTQWIISGAGIS